MIRSLPAVAVLVLAGAAAAAPADNAFRARAIRDVRAALDKTMVDYPSARFRDTWLAREGDDWMVCGYVNGKSGLGGYTGWTPFLAGPSKEGGATVAVGDGNLSAPLESACRKSSMPKLPGDISAQLAPRR